MNASRETARAGEAGKGFAVVADEISTSIRKISEMVENNAATARENSEISSSLGACAGALMDMIAQFRLR